MTEPSPCRRGCVWSGVDGEQPKPRTASHGNYCARCHGRIYRALRKVAPLTEHIVSMLGIKSRVEDGSQRVKSVPPMPLNAAAFNDANELYARLVYWCGVWAGKLNVQAPGPARRAWLAGGRVVGLPADVSPEDARYAVGIMSKWLLLNLDDVLGLWWFDDIEFFIDELAGDVETVSAKFPTEDVPTFSNKAPCPDDGGRLVMYPPRFFGDHQDIICETCGRVFSESQHEFFARVFRQTRDERVAGLRVSGHLTRKYAG